MLKLLSFAKPNTNRRLIPRKLLLLMPALLFCAISTGAHAVVIDFDSLETPTGGILMTSSPYTEDGFQISGTMLTYFSQDDLLYAGSAGLLVAAVAGTATLMNSVAGVAFNLNSIDLSIIAPQGTPTTVDFTGVTSANTLVSQSFQVSGFGFSQFDFDSSFTNLQSVSWTQGLNYLAGHQFDNINIATVPEPGTFGLISLALLGLAFARRKTAI